MAKNNNMSLLDNVLKKRKSTVLFSSKTVNEKKLMLLFEAARWAPSSHNQQPWRYVYGIKNKDKLFDGILNCLLEGNIEWAKNASVLIVSITESVSSYNNEINKYAWHDVGMANANLMTQAIILDLVSHPMGGFDSEKIRNLLKLDKNYDPVCIIALGYPATDADILDKHLIERENNERKRKPVDEIVINPK